jgi:hypothetical protein
MKLVKTSPPVWIWIGVALLFAFIFAVQIFLTVRQRYPAAVSDEFTDRSRAFTEEVKQTLEAQQAAQ